MELHLTDINPAVVQALRTSFAAHPEVLIHEGDILSIARHAVVSPCNALGFMDGGIARLYNDFFGPKAQNTLREHISVHGPLPVGESLLVKTGHSTIPYMLCTSITMNAKEATNSNVFYAMSATLNAIRRHPESLGVLYCPGIGCGEAGIGEADAAREMADAYGKWRARFG